MVYALDPLCLKFCKKVINSKINEIYYLAGDSSVIKSFETPDISLKSNTEGILNILQTLKRKKYKAKLFNAGSVEEEALNLLMHEKKIIEQEKELQALLNFRYGYGTWDELKEMRRKIRDRREKEVYKQAQMRRDLIEAMQIGFAILIVLGFVIGLMWFALDFRGII